MRKCNILFLTILLCVFCFSFSCTYTSDYSERESEYNRIMRSDSTNTEPVARDKDYYESKGYQVFANYQLAVKLPVVLKDISKVSKDDFDFNYAGENNDDFYQVTIIQLPAGRKDLTKYQYDILIKDMFSRLKGKEVFWGEEGMPAFLLRDYKHRGRPGKGIIIVYNGKVYGFNLITKKNIDMKFRKLTNNIKFLDEHNSTPNIVTDKTENNLTKKYTQPGFGEYSILYPNDWTLMKNPYKGVDVMIAAPIKHRDSEANINIIVSKDKKSIEYKYTLNEKQFKEFFPEYKLLYKRYISIGGMNCLEVNGRFKMGNIYKISTSYQFKKIDDTVYTITTTIDENSLDEYKELCSQIVKSFKLL